MQESRLFKMVYYLLEKGHTTAPELAQKFEVSVRTVYRDIDTLSTAGVPIYTEPGRGGGICLMEHFVLDKTVLSETEKQEILAGLQSISAARESDAGHTLSKLSAIFSVDSERWLEVDFARWGNKNEDNSRFDVMKSAIIHHRAIRITYANSEGATEERRIYPLKLSYRSKAWYVKAYCTKRKAYRLFKLTRITEWKLLEEEFSGYSFPEKEDGSGAVCQVKLRFPGEMAYRVYDEFDRTQIRQMENGDLQVLAQIPEDGWLLSFLLSCGSQVGVLEPAYLKKELAEQAKQIYEKNKI